MPTIYKDGHSKYVSDAALPSYLQVGWNTKMPIPSYADTRITRTLPPTPSAEIMIDQLTRVGATPWRQTQEPASPGFVAPGPGDLDHLENPYNQDLTDDEWANFDQFIGSLTTPEALPRWWSQGEDGLFYHTRTGASDLEHMQVDMGWSDNLLGAISDWYNQQTGFSVGEENPYGLPGGGGSGGGGGGYAGPVYVSPDRRTVEDTVKSMLLTMTGDAATQRISELADAYIAAHKSSWQIRQAGGEDVDPNQTALDLIREQADYKTIHTLRPETSDEMRWISDRKGRLEQLGVSPGDAEERSILMAQTGTGMADIETGQFQTSKGRKDISLMQRIQQSAEQVVGAL